MQKVNTSEYPEAELDYNSHHIGLNQQIQALTNAILDCPTDKVLPLLLQIAKINLKILKIVQNENISNS